MNNTPHLHVTQTHANTYTKYAQISILIIDLPTHYAPPPNLPTKYAYNILNLLSVRVDSRKLQYIAILRKTKRTPLAKETTKAWWKVPLPMTLMVSMRGHVHPLKRTLLSYYLKLPLSEIHNLPH